ncbi:GPO family capsid scaffolding protein [Croceicoccus sp. YJ47]|uniref:GPO family capsid scaffolding protein n=1 Tax=Croceicoccus sp. YJ47 TaxID=2798724 RepID=UPI00192073FF|nr:GPO family capsid scaffolding protein [Croceicoccus sp. YJ47]QQN73185.1 GPO family capsid scaffolding protein [Croceicoccus sp. YJ47]
MPKRSKFFCIAVEGATCDGRTLDRGALEEMAETYDPKTYTARINMEHIRGFSADAPFNAYGDVVALETRDVEIQLGGKTETKLGLFAQVDALDTLIELNGKGQKLFSSVELNPNFAGTGKAYLQGLAVTDSPASLGTEVMQFAAKASTNPFAERKVEKGNFFSAAHAVTGLEFSDGKNDPAETTALLAEAKGLFASMKQFFAGHPAPTEKEEPEVPEPANDNIAAFNALANGVNKLAAAVEQQGKDLTASFNQLRSDHDTLKASVENTDKGGTQRPLASGQNANFARTDC